jgi:hypothetical protein
MKSKLLMMAGAACLVMGAVEAKAAQVVVQSTDAIYDYSGAQVALGGSDTTPPTVSVASYAGKTITFSTTGQVSLTPGPLPYGPHGPDGGPNVFSSSIDSAAGLSAVYSNNVGYLAGVFINGSEGSTSSLPSSNFTGSGESFASLSPAVDQIFFIGDGLTGTGTGAVQSFVVPVGATELVLGIVDGYDYNGPPGAYFDNGGHYDVTVNLPGAVPEPGTWALMLAGLGGVGAMLRSGRRKTVAVAAA